LTEKMELLYEQYINKEIVTKQINHYIDLVQPFVQRMPDIQYLPHPLAEYDADIERILNTPKRSLDRYYEDLEKPKPFYLNEVEERDGHLYFNWGVSFDLQDDDLTYLFTIARDKQMQDI